MEFIKLSPVFSDSRGDIFDLLNGVDVRHVGIIMSKAGTVRGNHYHVKAHQYTYIVSGKMEYFERQGCSELEHVVLSKGDFVYTRAGCAHAIHFLEDSEILELTTESRADGGFEDDTKRLENPLINMPPPAQGGQQPRDFR